MEEKERIELLLSKNEWSVFECKRALTKPAKMLEAITALANTEGGTFVIGLEDPDKTENNKRLIGIEEGADNVSEFLKLIDKEILPPLHYQHFDLNLTNIDGEKDLLTILVIDKSNDIHSLRNGDTFVRKGKQTIKIGASEIIRLKYNKGSLKFEDESSLIVNLCALNPDLLSQYKKDTSSQSFDDWQFLKDNGLAIETQGKLNLTKAGVLLFAKNPTTTLKTKCGIKISHYYGTKPHYSQEPNFVTRPFTIEGPLIKQIEHTIEYFRNLVKNSPPKLSGATFRPTFLIPEWAFQEAITNAVIHRNYSIEDDIQVRFFDDRVEIESPGTYPGHITTSNIRSERYARNPIILRTLNRFQSAPNLDIGEGVDRMFKVMRDQNLYEPLYFPPSFKPNSVLLLLFNLQKIEYWDTVSIFLDENYGITNEKAREITGISDTLIMSRHLKTWVDQGLLEKFGKGKRDTYYRKSGQGLPNTLFSEGVENKND
jgi:ATP-dependent DNA helicase RecG